MTPTDFQQAVLSFRAASNIFNGGGRGSGKSVTLALDVVDRCRILQHRARPCVTRESWSGLAQLRDLIADLSRDAFGKVDGNKSDGTLTIPGTGSVIQFTQIADDASYTKHQGKTYCSLYQDEFGAYGPASVAYSDRLRSNVRTPPGIRPHIHRNANPMGRAHAICMRRYVMRSPPGVPFREDPKDDNSAWWTWFTSDFTANPHLDGESYERQIIQSTAGQTQLQRAWLTGTWENAGGSMFPLEPAIHIVPPHVIGNLVRPLARLGGDWGVSAPATALLGYISRHQLGPARPGSLFIADTVDTADPNNLSIGMGYTPVAFAEMVKDMLERWGESPATPFVCDDARSMTSHDTVISLLQDAGLDAYKPSKKDRVGAWALINQMLDNAKTGNGPGLFIVNTNQHLIETMEEAPRDELRPEDVSAKWQKDHWLDALNYLTTDVYGSKSTGHSSYIGGY
ncbi:MAG: hypothetical protein KJ622_03710 [Alphaproteobacteria bacterium]|nr:hypothetical protein [Alphaproteobacteria bacterium]